MYQFETRVRYSECGVKERAGLSHIFDYLQDICTMHAEDLNVGVDYMEGHQSAFILNSWQVDIVRYPVLSEKIQIATWPYEFNGFYGLRNCKIEDGSGEILVRANSVWIFMDMQKGRPAKIPPKLAGVYQAELGRRMDMEYLDRKIPDFEAEAAGNCIQIPRHFIDSNNHVNNAKYILLAEELLPVDFEAARVRVEYRKSAVYGAVLYPYAMQKPGKVLVKLCDENKKPYAVIEFSERSHI